MRLKAIAKSIMTLSAFAPLREMVFHAKTQRRKEKSKEVMQRA